MASKPTEQCVIPSHSDYLSDEERQRIDPQIGDVTGSPSKLRRHKIPPVAPNNTKKTRCGYFFLVIVLQILVVGAVVGLMLRFLGDNVGVTMQSSSNSTLSLDYNYTKCVEGWIYPAQEMSVDEPCINHNSENNCKTTINCCWVNERCSTYKEEPDCTILIDKDACLGNTFCFWRPNDQICRRSFPEKEITEFDTCKQNWANSPRGNRATIDCSDFQFEGDCVAEVGCCWKEGNCVTFGYEPECSTWTNKASCEESVLPCAWQKVKCLRDESSSETPALITRYPTVTKTRKPTLIPTTSLSSQGSTSLTVNPTTAKPARNPIFTTSRPSRVPVQPTLTNKPSFAPLIKPTSLPTPQFTNKPPTETTAKRKTSILILLADDLGWGDVTYIEKSPYFSTPNIDEMSRSKYSVRFDRFHSPALSCSPSRASIMSGQSNIKDCVWGANAMYDKPKMTYRPDFPFQGEIDQTLPSYAKRAGYKTILLGKWHLNSLDTIGSWGFDTWLASGGNLPTFDSTCFCSANTNACFRGHYSDPDKLGPNYGCYVVEGPSNVKGSIRNSSSSQYLIGIFEKFILNLQESDSFFAYVAFNEPHIPFIANPWYRTQLLQGIGLSQRSDRSLAADYYGALMAMDDALGRARRILSATGRNEDTIVIFTSDNGPELWSMGGYGSTGGLKGRKRSLFEGGHRVPVSSPLNQGESEAMVKLTNSTFRLAGNLGMASSN